MPTSKVAFTMFPKKSDGGEEVVARHVAAGRVRRTSDQFHDARRAFASFETIFVAGPHASWNGEIETDKAYARRLAERARHHETASAEPSAKPTN
jgi:hypothetical protein